jgi:hypothetical protein
MGFRQVLWLPVSILILPAAPHSSYSLHTDSVVKQSTPKKYVLCDMRAMRLSSLNIGVLISLIRLELLK